MGIGIIFDMDNTLVRSHIDFAGLRGEMLVRLEKYLPLTPEAINSPISRLLEIAGVYDKEEGTSLQQELWNLVIRYETAGMQNIDVEAGAVEVCRELQSRGFKLAVCTNNSRSATDHALRLFADTIKFDQVVTRDDVDRLKPDPEGVLLISAVWLSEGVTSVFFVGDSWIDGRAAEEAGVPFVKYGREEMNTRRHEGQRFAQWHVVDHLEELLALPWS